MASRILRAVSTPGDLPLEVLRAKKKSIPIHTANMNLYTMYSLSYPLQNLSIHVAIIYLCIVVTLFRKTGWNLQTKPQSVPLLQLETSLPHYHLFPPIHDVAHMDENMILVMK